MERFLRAYRKVLMVALIFMALPIMVASFYARPLGDDLNMSLEAARTWRETGSVGQMLVAGLESAVYYYRTWSGLLAYMFVGALPLSVFDPKLIGLNVIMSLGLLLWGAWCVARCLKTVCKNFSKAAASCTWMLLGLMMLLLMPNYCESLFWYSGAASYTWGSALQMAVFSALIAGCCGENVKTARIVLWSIGAFCWAA